MYKMSPAKFASLSPQQRVMASVNGFAAVRNNAQVKYAQGGQSQIVPDSAPMKALIRGTLEAPTVGTVIRGGRYVVTPSGNQLERTPFWTQGRTRLPESQIVPGRAGVTRLSGLGVVEEPFIELATTATSEPAPPPMRMRVGAPRLTLDAEAKVQALQAKTALDTAQAADLEALARMAAAREAAAREAAKKEAAAREAGSGGSDGSEGSGGSGGSSESSKQVDAAALPVTAPSTMPNWLLPVGVGVLVLGAVYWANR